MRLKVAVSFCSLVASTLLSCGRPRPESQQPLTAASETALDSGPFGGLNVVNLRNGINDVDLDLDGQLDRVLIAWRENYNAHGYSAVTFLWRNPGGAPGPIWQLIPFVERGGQGGFDTYRTVEGADCRLSDVRVLRDNTASRRATLVIVGTRELGGTYADSAAVSFAVYEMSRNADGEAGTPTLYFASGRRISATSLYCDIGQAFSAELGIPPMATVE
jgi:hypothetical protein